MAASRTVTLEASASQHLTPVQSANVARFDAMVSSPVASVFLAVRRSDASMTSIAKGSFPQGSE